jgi:hypothetical protein
MVSVEHWGELSWAFFCQGLVDVFMAQIHLLLEKLKLIQQGAIVKLPSSLCNPAVLALLGSVGIHGIVLLSLPVNRLGNTKPLPIKAVNMVELTSAEKSRLPKLTTAPITSLPIQKPGFQFAPLPTIKLPESSIGSSGSSFG